VREMISFPPDMRNQAYATPHSRDPESVNLSGDVLTNLASLSLAESSALLGIAVFLGLIASWVTSARHMRRIEPR
jgi:hypothetical protein